jgi:hypothetical protein
MRVPVGDDLAALLKGLGMGFFPEDDAVEL